MTKSIKVFVSSVAIALLFSTFPVTIKDISPGVAIYGVTSGVISEMYEKPIGKLYAGVTSRIPVKMKEVPVQTPIAVTPRVEPVVAEPPVVIETPPLMCDSDVIMIARLTMAEAEGESELGKRLVIDTVLNRMDKTGSSVHDVIWAKNQYTSMWNGRYEQMSAPEDVCNLVLQEVESRTNSNVYYFSAGVYSNFGKTMFKEGHHCFSSYK